MLATKRGRVGQHVGSPDLRFSAACQGILRSLRRLQPSPAAGCSVIGDTAPANPALASTFRPIGTSQTKDRALENVTAEVVCTRSTRTADGSGAALVAYRAGPQASGRAPSGAGHQQRNRRGDGRSTRGAGGPRLEGCKKLAKRGKRSMGAAP